MDEVDKGSSMIRMGVSGWVFLLVPAYPGCPGPKAVKQLCVCVCVCHNCWEVRTSIVVVCACAGACQFDSANRLLVIHSLARLHPPPTFRRTSHWFVDQQRVVYLLILTNKIYQNSTTVPALASRNADSASLNDDVVTAVIPAPNDSFVDVCFNCTKRQFVIVIVIQKPDGIAKWLLDWFSAALINFTFSTTRSYVDKFHCLIFVWINFNLRC